ncbi:calpastatin [Pararhizobium polonicum]|uniref:Calpastatin n=1 Tax=Pararhizobium polonicum TaxID=1612624 RepID=A0A1C7P689_9HYPH|nr:DUF1810 domain-containing protein [Pararhizobium polonicum]OBZ96782.1 calpastatin [Pararhizobium polonicum]
MSDLYHLSRFVEAQEPVYETALRELEHGRKQSHWMWFIFPQITGLGHSLTAQRFAISSLEEARAYLAHPLLGGRLVQCTRTINAVRNRTALQIFGSPDDMKLRSSMTLFWQAARDPEPFWLAIERYFGSEADPRTLDILASASTGSNT